MVGDAVAVAYLSYLRVGLEFVVCACMLSLFVCTFCHSIFNFTRYFLKSSPGATVFEENSSYTQRVLEVLEMGLENKNPRAPIGPSDAKNPYA